MGLIFEVAEGGFLDIDVKIYGPDDKIIHQECFSARLKSELGIRILSWLDPDIL